MNVIDFGLVRVLRYLSSYYGSRGDLCAQGSTGIVRQLSAIVIECNDQTLINDFESEEVIIPTRTVVNNYYRHMLYNEFKVKFPDYCQISSGLIVSRNVARLVNEGDNRTYQPLHGLYLRFVY